METTLTVIGLVLAAAIVLATAGVAFYKWHYNTKANFAPRDKK